MSARHTILETARGAFGIMEIPGPANAPLLLFAHATGMCAAIYEPLLAPLAGRFRPVAFDARGHGASAACPAAEPLADWQIFRADLAAIADALGGGPILLAGHSFGATVALETAVMHPGLADAVLMVEPAFIPFIHATAYAAARAGGENPPNPMAERAERRRAAFGSLAEMRASWRGRGVFADWPDAALDAYLTHATRPDPEGVRLACTPAFEADIFRGVSTTLGASLRAVSFPLVVVHGTVGSTVSAPDSAAIAAMGHQVIVVDGGSHFLPVTEPGRVRPAFDLLRPAGLPQPRRAER
jgi:pimeloyl-ACP methyl ester carboxylesterase